MMSHFSESDVWFYFLTARDNLVFLQRWFTKFPEFKNNDFFITGESYAGSNICLWSMNNVSFCVVSVR